MNTTKQKANRLGIFFLKPLLRLFYVVPMNVLYLFSPLLQTILTSITNYRKDVIYQNLKNSLVDEEDTTIHKIRSDNYQHLSEIILENLKVFSGGSFRSSLSFDIANPEILNSLFEEKKDVILMTGHLGNWELGFSHASEFFKHDVYGVYKEQSNEEFDKYLYKLRTQRGLTLITEKQFVRSILSEKEVPRIFVLIPDQSPKTNKSIAFFTFLNQRTAFSTSLEKIAVRFDLPVVFADIVKIKRGQYQSRLMWLYKGKGDHPKITSQYAKHLERNILSDPSIWLWSHRRWKHS